VWNCVLFLALFTDVRGKLVSQVVTQLPHADVNTFLSPSALLCIAALLRINVYSIMFVDHSRSGVVYNFGRFCLAVCMSVCLSDNNFRKPWRRKFIFAHISPGNTGQVRIWRSSGQYQGHRSKKSSATFQFDPGMLKVPSPITHRLTVFTGQHGMQTRSSDENSVCPSVCLSVTRVVCDKMVERYVQIYIPYERTFSLVFWEEEWLWGWPLLPEILGQLGRHVNMTMGNFTRQICARSMQL